MNFGKCDLGRGECNISFPGRSPDFWPVLKLPFPTHPGPAGGDFQTNGLLRRGDLIGVTGYVGKSRKGELSVFPTSMQLLAPCLHMLPNLKGGLMNQEVSVVLFDKDNVSIALLVPVNRSFTRGAGDGSLMYDAHTHTAFSCVENSVACVADRRATDSATWT